MGFADRLWQDRFRRIYQPHLERFVDFIESRLLKSFDNLEQEAESRVDEAWDEWCANAGEDADPGEGAADAEAAGINYYFSMIAIRQTFLNLSAVGLYHAWEQQVIEFMRQQILHPDTQDDISLMNLSQFKKLAALENIDVEHFESWPTVDSLRILSNAIKHAEGSSAAQLKLLRPDLFVAPGLTESDFIKGFSLPVYSPLSGLDIYVTIDVLRDYCAALRKFWDELADAMERLFLDRMKELQTE
jgi:hypothetical protein